MFRRIVKAAWVGLALFYFMPAQASPNGFYIRGSGMLYTGIKSPKREKLAAFVALGWQANRATIVEGAWTLPWVAMKDGEKVKNALTMTWKHVIPLKYYFNIYKQVGCSWKSDLGMHGAFWGLGATYHPTRSVIIEGSWRNYALFSKLAEKGSSDARQNGLTVGAGYYFR